MKKLVKENIGFERGRDPKKGLDVGMNSKSRILKMHGIIEDYISQMSSEEMDNATYLASEEPEEYSFDDWRIRWGTSYDEALKIIEGKVINLKSDLESYWKLDDSIIDKYELIARDAISLNRWLIYKKQAEDGTGLVFFKHLFE